MSKPQRRVDKEYVKKLVEQGVTVTQISKRLGVGVKTIYKICKELGIKAAGGGSMDKYYTGVEKSSIAETGELPLGSRLLTVRDPNQ